MALFSLFKAHAARFLLSLGIILLGLLHVVDVVPLGFMHKLENFTYDARLTLLMPHSIDGRIVIVDIDERSLQAQGRWPWGRDKLADMVNKLFDTYHINTLGFDVVFAEKDESSGLKNLQKIQQTYLKGDVSFERALESIKPSLDYDQIFANSFKGRKVVLGYYFQTNGDQHKVGLLPDPVFDPDSFSDRPIAFTQATGFGANLSSLQDVAISGGHFNPQPDADGITRRVSVIIDYAGKYYDSLAVAVARAYLANQVLMPEFAEVGANDQYAGLEALTLGEHRIPVDDAAAALVPYRGRQGSFRYVSATDVLTGKAPAASLKDKIVLVGTTAPGLMDLRATPVQSAYPGVEVHANMISGILDNNIKARPAYIVGTEFLMVLIAGLLLLLLPVLNPLRATLLTIAIVAAVLLLSVFSWQKANLVLPIATTLMMAGLIYLVNMSYGFFVESRSKRQLAGLFGQYIPPELVAEMAKDPEAIQMEGENREMTVLFSDIRGFTDMAENLDPKQLSQLINEFLTHMTHIIHQHRGTIDKYIGDAIMAFWGAPLTDKLHARNALEAAMQMQAEMSELNHKFAAKNWPQIRVGIGLNSGNMVVGNMGSNFRMAYTVMGDSVNLSSRLEGLTKYYGADIVVSEYVRNQVPELVYRELDLVRVKGKDVAVRIYEPVANVDAATVEELEQYHQALQHYRNQHWKLAETILKALQKATPKPIYAVYLARIQQYIQAPPDESWDGAYSFDTK